jgi:hypothetical protein
MSMGEHLITQFPNLIDNRDMSLHVGKSSDRKDTRSSLAPVGRAKSQNRDSESGSIRGDHESGQAGLILKGTLSLQTLTLDRQVRESLSIRKKQEPQKQKAWSQPPSHLSLRRSE